MQDKSLKPGQNSLLPVECPPKKRTGAPAYNANGEVHGHYTLKRAVKELGSRAIDRRTSLGKALAQWRADLIRDLGGDISKQQETIVDLAATTKLLVDSLDVWLLTQPSLVLKRKRMVLPVVLQRQQLADSLAGYMSKLGLDRRVRDTTPSLAEIRAQFTKDTDAEEETT